MAQSTMLLKIKAPTLILLGMQDPACTYEQSTVLHRLISQSSLVTIDQAAHLANIEKPAEFNRALRQFLDSVA
jgi:3-oxoadipate enol-lactonase